MPELGPKNVSFIKALKDKLKKLEDDGIFTFEIEKLAKDYDEKYVGSGREVVVVAYKDNPESQKLVAFNYRDMSAKEAKEIFYLHRFFSTLFPHNFPHFYAVAGKNPKSENANISGTVRQEIKKYDLNSLNQAIELSTGRPPTLYPFRKVEQICHQLGIDMDCDPFERNFIFGNDGGEYYVDKIISSNIIHCDIDNIIQYMKKNNYTTEEIEIARRSVERLKAIELDKY